MEFTPIWFVTLSVYIVTVLAILFLAKFTAKPVDSYPFSFKRMFPFEVINHNQKAATIYRIILCIFVAAAFAPIFNLFTNYGKIANIQGLSIVICCSYGLAAICFAFLHHFDATHTSAHLILFVCFMCLTLLANALAAVKGVAVYQVYAKHGQNMIVCLLGTIICGICAIISIIMSVNPKLKHWANLEKIDGVDAGYVRPKKFILAWSEWLTFFMLAVGELSYFMILLVQ